MTDIVKALAIDGWMSEPELLWLAEMASKHSSIVEIGSYLGRSTRAMLDNTVGTVYALDDWLGPRDVYMSREERQTLLGRFTANTAGTRGRRMWIRCNHRQIDWPEDDRVDMVFLDGSHEYADVLFDIQFWRKRVYGGGLLCGHDADAPDVQQAVVDELGECEVADGTTIWFKVL